MTNPLLKPIFDEMFAGDGWEGFAAALEELDIEATPESCRAAFDVLPETIKLELHMNGLGDTCSRDEAYVYLKSINYGK